MSNKKDGKVSVANILALLGIAAIGVVMFLGFMLKSDDGSPGIPGVLAAIVMAALGFLLFLIIKAKTADNNPDKWVFVEWGGLFAYLIVAAVSAPVFLHFFDVFSHKDELQSMANTEIQSVKKIYGDFEDEKTKALNAAEEQANNYLLSKKDIPEMNEIFFENLDKNTKSLESWKENADKALSLGNFDLKLDSIKYEIKNWNWINIASLAKRLEKLDVNVKKDLEEKIEKLKKDSKLVPIISADYKLTGYHDFKIAEGPEPKFSNAINNSSVNSVLGWVLLFVLHLIILFSYLVARRANYLKKRNDVQINGVRL